MPVPGKKTEGKTEYMISHRPSEVGPPAHDMFADVEGDGPMSPSDLFKSPEHYIGTKDRKDPVFLETKKQMEYIKSIQGDPEAEITVYRSSPEKELNDGDWVSLSKEYAKQAGYHPTDEAKDIPVFEHKIKVKDLKWDGNSLEEWGYFPEEVKLLLNAGRYASIFKQQVQGQNLSYYDLESHPAVLNEIVKNSKASTAQVQEYLETPYKQRNALQKESQVWRDIDKAMNKSKAEKGALYNLKEEFISQAPEEWLMAMIQAGYTYQGSQRDSELFSDQLRKGMAYTFPTSSDFEGMYRKTRVESAR